MCNIPDEDFMVGIKNDSGEFDGDSNKFELKNLFTSSSDLLIVWAKSISE